MGENRKKKSRKTKRKQRIWKTENRDERGATGVSRYFSEERLIRTAWESEETMGRHKKKTTNPVDSMRQLVEQAMNLFEEPYDDRDGREDELPSVRSVADEMGTTILRVRKLLITADFYSTEISRRIQELAEQGYSVNEIMEETELGRASVYSYLPYQRLAFNLDQSTVNADRLKLFRRRKKATDELIRHLGRADVEDYLWKAIVLFENYPFSIMKGQKFSYKIKRGRTGLPTEEIAIDRQEKTITRATINLAFHKAMNLQRKAGYVSGPKKICSFEASYLYPLFLRFGVIRRE